MCLLVSYSWTLECHSLGTLCGASGKVLAQCWTERGRTSDGLLRLHFLSQVYGDCVPEAPEAKHNHYECSSHILRPTQGESFGQSNHSHWRRQHYLHFIDKETNQRD